MRSGKSVVTDSSESDGVILVKNDVDRARDFFFGGYVHYVSVCHVACVDVSCLWSPEALLPSGNRSTNTADSSLASIEAARAAYMCMQRHGLPYWVEPASAAAERKREKEHFLSSGDDMSSSLQNYTGWLLNRKWKQKGIKASFVLGILACFPLFALGGQPSDQGVLTCTGDGKNVVLEVSVSYVKCYWRDKRFHVCESSMMATCIELVWDGGNVYRTCLRHKRAAWPVHVHACT